MLLQLSDMILASYEPFLFVIESTAQFAKKLKHIMSAIASCITLYIVWHMVVIILLKLTNIVSRRLRNYKKSI